LPERGAVLVFALLVMVVGATVLGGIAQIAVTQSVAGQTEWGAAARRVQIENSRALARQYILTQMWQGYGSLATATLDNAQTGGRGGFVITGVEPETGFWLSLDSPGTDRINPFTLFERGGFQSAWASAQLFSDAATNRVAWGFQLRTRSPIVAGFAFVNQRDATNAWSPDRWINMRQTNDYASGFPAIPRTAISSVTNTAVPPATALLSNLGFLSVPKAEARFGNLLSLTTNGITPTNGRIELDLGVFSYGSPHPDDSFFYEVPNSVAAGTNMMDITELRLIGTGSGGLPPVQVLIPSSNTKLTTVTLDGNNSRIVYLYRQRPALANYVLSIATGGGNRSFRIGMTLHCRANLNISGGLDLVGGFRTDELLTPVTGNFALLPETSPTWKYDAIADRMMWLEDQRER